MQSKMYNEVRKIKYYADRFVANQSKDDAILYQQSIIQAINNATEICDWLNKKDIFELNELILLVSFYIINLSDISFRNPIEFSDVEITNTINTFLFTLGAQDQVDISLIRICINWLLRHPVD
jgi:hypothetical protein